MVTAFTEAIYSRSLDKLRHSALQAANTLVDLMTDKNVDASVRRQAAESDSWSPGIGRLDVIELRHVAEAIGTTLENMVSHLT